jgi:predicted SAM-dependent methyltransferase
MTGSDLYERHLQPFVKRFLTTGKGRQLYVWAGIRVATRLVWPYFRIRAALGAFDGAKVNLGAGASRMKGWVNADANPLRRPHVWMDARNRWPFKPDSLAGVATSHFLEHLFDDELGSVLANVRRILRPGGFFRISVPSLEKAVEEYLARGRDGAPALEERGEKFHLVCHWYGAHHQIFDFARLSKLVRLAGFVDIKKQDFPQSNFCTREEVAEIDRHPDESLFVECVKPHRLARIEEQAGRVLADRHRT